MEDQADMDKVYNYKGIFVAGIAFMGSGVALSVILGPVGFGLLGVGIGLMAVGLAKRDEWE